MSDDIAPEADEAFETPEPPEELKEQYEGAYEERQEQQEAMLAAVRGEEEWTVDSWTWVSLNNAQLEVREDVPGDVMRMLSADESDVEDGMNVVDTYIEGLVRQTRTVKAEGYEWDSEEDIRAFYHLILDDLGTTGLLRALESVLSAVDSEQLKGEIAQSFPENR